MLTKESRIYVAGHHGLVGSAVVRLLMDRGYRNIITTTKAALDLRCRARVQTFFQEEQPEFVFLCAAKVGGIKANAEDPLAFFFDNIDIQRNVMMSAADNGVEKLLFLGSSCIYPKMCPQPIRPEYLLTGPIEPTTEPYALAKISGIRLCQWLRRVRGCNFISAQPCNIFGPRDYFNEEHGHLIPSMMARMHRAKCFNWPSFPVWGDGFAHRELLYSDDLAEALLLLMAEYNGVEPVNVGSSQEHEIRQIAEMLKNVIGYQGALHYDATQPVGTPRKVLDNTEIFRMGWAPRTPVYEALQRTYSFFIGAGEKRGLTP